MKRWSLRRHPHRAQRPVTGTYRLDPVQPELESAIATGCRPDASASGASRDLRTPAGREQGELSGIDTSLLDVIRMALSAIERYTHEDSGIGMAPDGVAALNAMLAGDVPELDDRAGRHAGFPVAHRISCKYSVGVRFAARPAPGRGTIALVAPPPELMSGIPGEDLDRPQAPPPAPRPPGQRVRAARRPAPPKPREAASSPGPAMISVPALAPVPAATARRPGDHPRSRPRPGGPSPTTSPYSR